MGLSTPASAEGELAGAPFAHLLVYARDRQLTGALIIGAPDGVEHVVRLADGRPVMVRSSDRFALLGEILLEMGAITLASLDGALSSKAPLGDVLVLSGLIEPSTVERALDQQFFRRMVRLFALPPESTYRYHPTDSDPGLEDWGTESSIDLLEVLWAGLREHAEVSTMMEGTLARLGDLVPRLHEQAAVERFRLSPNDREALALIETHPMPLEQLLALEAVPAGTLKRLVYALIITRQLDFGVGVLPIGAEDPRPTPAGPVGVARVQLRSAAHRRGAAAPDPPGDGERGSKVPSTRALRRGWGGSPSSPGDEATGSAPEARTSRPSGQGATTDELDWESNARGDRMSAMSHEDAPAHEPPASHDEVAQRGPRTLLQLAQRRIEQSDVLGGLAACELARLAAPDDPDIAVEVLRLRASLPGADLERLAMELDAQLVEHGDHARSHVLRGVLHRRLGDDAMATCHFERALHLDPGCAEAALELATMALAAPGSHARSLGE